MRYIEDEGRIVWSASDLKAAAECEFAWLRAIDAKLGRVPAVEDPEDATLERAGRLGTQHELRVLADYREMHPGRVVEIPETRSSDAEGLDAAINLTRRAPADPDVAVIYQAAFSTDEFVGFADFLVREWALPDRSGAGGAVAGGRAFPTVAPATPGASDASGASVASAAPDASAALLTRPAEERAARWVVQDTKLARHARVTALMQLAAYVDQLDRLSVPRSRQVELLLGDGSTSVHAVRDLLPVFALRRDRLRALIADRDLDAGAAGDAIAWGDDRGALRVVACGRCAT